MPATSPNRQDWIEEYGRAYGADYSFESVLVACRHRQVANLVGTCAPEVVLEIGCGLDLLVSTVRRAEDLAAARLFERWVAVEPNATFADRVAAVGDARVTVVHGFLEDVWAEALDRCGRPPDLVICTSLLHEVPDTEAFLAAIRRVSGPDTLVHVSVPNARSLHRRLARTMGLIDDEFELSERNRRFGQALVFDRDTLCQHLERAGFDVIRSGGSFLKLFDHRHMEEIPFLVPTMLDGLDELGRELPDLAAEIFAEARPI